MWTRALLLDAFSERRVAIGANVALLSVLSLRAAHEPVGDPDAWWIAAAGRELIARGAVPRTNGWSITDPSHPWVFHEWLISPLYALGCARWGSSFVALLGVAGACITITALLFAHRRAGVRDDTAGWTVFAWLLAAQSSAVSPRPGYALLALPLCVLALTRTPRWTPRTALSLALLTALWTNAHGSFPLALLLVGAAALRVTGSERWSRLSALLLAAAATLANPYGLALHRLVLRYLVGGDPMAAVLRREVLEFRPLWTWPAPFANPWIVTACAGLAALALHGLRRGRRSTRVDAGLTLLLVAMGVMQSRHLVLAALMGFALLAPQADLLRRERAPWTLPRSPVLIALPLALALLVVRGRERVAMSLGGQALPRLIAGAGALRAWVPFDATGWFLWNARAHNDARLLFDARNDCHRAEVAEDALALERGQGAACEVLARHGVTTALAPTDHPVLQRILRCDGWRVVRSEGGWSRALRAQPPTIGQTWPVAGFTRPGWSLQ